MSDYFEIVMVIPDAPASADTSFSGNRPPTGAALSHANSNAAELMATLELLNIRISELNAALAQANAEAAELMASLDIA